MRRKYVSVGTRYEFTAPASAGIVSGSRAIIELQRRDAEHEVWRWWWCFKDGSGAESDWAPNYRKAVEECRVLFMGRCKVRFKLVKEE